MLGWNLVESLGLPTVGYLTGQALGGRDAAMLTATGIICLIAVLRRVIAGSVPGLVVISAVMMSVQTLIMVTTGSDWVFLLHFPLANMAMAVAFARTAQTATPLVGRLAREIFGLRTPSIHHPGLHGFFRGATWFWAGVFLLKTIGFSILMLTTPITVFLLLMSVTTAGAVVLGAVLCAVWFATVLRRSGLRLRFAA